MRWLFFLVCVMTLVLQSCLIVGNEEVILNKDGSGAVRVSYKIPKVGVSGDHIRALPNMFERYADSVEGAFATRAEVIEDVGFWRLDFKMTVAGPKVLHELYLLSLEVTKKEGVGEVEKLFALAVGRISAGLKNAGTFSYEREFRIGEMLPSSIRNNPSLLGNSAIKVKVKLPMSVASTNAHRLSSDGMSMEWDFVLKESLGEPMLTQFKTDIPSVEVREILTLRENGSGVIELQCDIPFAVCGEEELRVLRGKIEECVAEYSGIDLEVFEIEESGIFQKLRVRISFSWILKIKAMLEDRLMSELGSDVQQFVGSIDPQLSFSEVNVVRRISVGELLLRETMGERRLLEGSVLKYVVHLPYACNSSNADKVSEDGKRLEWTYALDRVNQIEMKYALPIKLPWWLWVAIIGSVTGFALLARWLIIRKVRALKRGKLSEI